MCHATLQNNYVRISYKKAYIGFTCYHSVPLFQSIITPTPIILLIVYQHAYDPGGKAMMPKSSQKFDCASNDITSGLPMMMSSCQRQGILWDSCYWWHHLWVPFSQVRPGLETGCTAQIHSKRNQT